MTTAPLTRADLRYTPGSLLQHRNPSEHPFSLHRWQTCRPCAINQTLYVIVGSEDSPHTYTALTLLQFSAHPLVADSDPLPAPLTPLPNITSLSPAARALTTRIMLGYPLPDDTDPTIDALAAEIRGAGITLHPPGKLLELQNLVRQDTLLKPPTPAADAPAAEIEEHIAHRLDTPTLPIPTYAPALPLTDAPTPDNPTALTDAYMVVQNLSAEAFAQIDGALISHPTSARQSWPFKRMTVGQMVRIPPDLSEKAIHAAHSYAQSTGYKRFSIRRDPQPISDNIHLHASETPVLTSVTIIRLSDRPNSQKRNENKRKHLTP